MAATPSGLDAGTLVGQAIDKVEDGLADVALPALLVGAAVTAVGFGWRFARRLAKG